MNATDLYSYLHFHGWRSHPSTLGPFGIAPTLERRTDRHGGVSHVIAPNGTACGCESSALAAVMVRCVTEMRMS